MGAILISMLIGLKFTTMQTKSIEAFPAISGQDKVLNIPPKCYLLDLPAEVRNHITEILVEAERSNLKIDLVEKFITTPPPPIAKTCRQLRSEVLPMSFSRASCYVLDLDASDHWAKTKLWLEATPEYTPLIKEWKFYYFCKYHITKLHINFNLHDASGDSVCEMTMDRGRIKRTCVSAERWNIVKHEFKAVLRKCRLTGFSADEVIYLVNLMIDGEFSYHCKY